MTNSAEWPAYYPKGVPPATAADAKGRAYRIVRTVPPAPVDFRSTFEEWAEQGKPVPADDLWRACGTSVHTDLAESRATRERYKPLRTRKIVVGDLEPPHGKMMPTGGPAHVTVWFRVAAKPESAFTKDAEAAA